MAGGRRTRVFEKNSRTSATARQVCETKIETIAAAEETNAKPNA
jgi:hypothetical protein